MAFRLDYVRSRLPGREIHHYDTIDSTMHEAEALAGTGSPSGTAVLADEQTAGLGRHGHSWHSERNAGVYCSVVLRLDLPPSAVPILTLALGLAAAEAIERAAGIACDIRWPNDLMIRDRKTGGILVRLVQASQPLSSQASASSAQVGQASACQLIAGIGINIGHTIFPSDLEDLATSLLLETGRAPSREDLTIELLPAVDRWCEILATHGPGVIISLFTQRSTYAEGRRVFAGDLIGTTAGLTESGFLLIDTDDGKRETILAGGVRAAGIGRR
jgi:BirA family transcriptional regulator, biotin operon repressor / biotin---[acetyl-CoA-carboxylase] ligase